MCRQIYIFRTIIHKTLKMGLDFNLIKSKRLSNYDDDNSNNKNNDNSKRQYLEPVCLCVFFLLNVSFSFQIFYSLMCVCMFCFFWPPLSTCFSYVSFSRSFVQFERTIFFVDKVNHILFFHCN